MCAIVSPLLRKLGKKSLIFALNKKSIILSTCNNNHIICFNTYIINNKFHVYIKFLNFIFKINDFIYLLFGVLRDFFKIKYYIK